MLNLYYPYIIAFSAGLTYWLLSLSTINNFFKKYIPEKFSRMTSFSMIIFSAVFIISMIIQYIDSMNEITL